MLALLAGAALCHIGRHIPNFPPASHLSSKVQDVRLRTILPNGAVIYVEQTPPEGRLTLQLFVSGRFSPDSPKTNGYRHLWEHLVAKGRNRTLDQQLESNGAFLTAETYRDATVFQIVLRPTDLKLGLDAVHSLTELGELTAEDIAKEALIIKQEVALEPNSKILASQAWKLSFGDAGLDPVGDPDIIAAANPSAIQRLHQSLMTGANVTLLIAGDVDLDSATQAARDALVAMPAGIGVPPSARKFLGGGPNSSDVVGAALALPVSSWNAPSTAARLAASLAIASNLKQAFVTFTPSLEGSLIIVGDVNSSSPISHDLANVDPAGLFGLGRSLAHRWVDKEDGLGANGILAGLLLSEGAGQRVKTMHDDLDRMTVAEFTAAFRAFLSKNAVEIVGK